MDEKTGSFTYDELIMLSDGILSMMENTNKALALIKSSEVYDILSKELEKYRQLNNKICDMMGEEGE